MWLVKSNEHLHHQKKFLCVCMHKMVDISKKAYESNDMEVIVDGTGTILLHEKHAEEKSSHKNVPVITNKYDPAYKKQRYELVDRPKEQPNRRFFA